MTVRQRSVVSGTDTDRVSERVIEALTDSSSVGPLESGERLYDVIDPDALDRLFMNGGIDGALEFTFSDYRIRVSGLGEIEISPDVA